MLPPSRPPDIVGTGPPDRDDRPGADAPDPGVLGWRHVRDAATVRWRRWRSMPMVRRASVSLLVAAGITAAAVLQNGLPDSPVAEERADTEVEPAWPGFPAYVPYNLVVWTTEGVYRLRQQFSVSGTYEYPSSIETDLIPTQRIDTPIEAISDGPRTALIVPAAGGGQTAVIIDQEILQIVVHGPVMRVLREPNGKALWLARLVGADMQVTRYTMQRSPAELVTVAPLPPWQSVPAGAGEPVAATADGLVLSGTGVRLSVWRPGTDVVRPIGPPGVVRSVGTRTVVVEPAGCGIPSRCPYWLVNTSTGDGYPIRPPRAAQPLGPPAPDRSDAFIAFYADPDPDDRRSERALYVGPVGREPSRVKGPSAANPDGSPGELPVWSENGWVFIPLGRQVYAHKPSRGGLYLVDSGAAGIPLNVWAR